MEKRQFDGDFCIERRLLCYGAAALFGVLVLGEALFLFGDHSFHGLVLAASGLSFVLIGSVGIVLFLRYWSLPVFREKMDLMSEFKPVQTVVDELEARIEEARRARESIEAEKKSAVEQRKWAYERQLTEIDKRRLKIERAQQQEILSELQRRQARYVADGLRASLIGDAEIRGVGPKLKRQLAISGIETAADVTFERVNSVSGFGSKKTTSMVMWSGGVASYLERTKPKRIPRNVESSIREKHRPQTKQIDLEKQQARAALDDDLMAIRERATRRHKENDAQETDAREQLTKRMPEYETLTAQLDGYSEINPLNFVLVCLQGKGDKQRARPRLLTILILLVFVSSLFCQGSTALRTLAAMALEHGVTVTPVAVTDSRLAELAHTAVMPAAPLSLTDLATTAPTKGLTPTPPLPTATTNILAQTAVPTASPQASPTLEMTATSTPVVSSAGVDVVLAYNPGPGALAQYMDPGMILGDPDLVENPCCQGMVQLGREGSMLVAFVDNLAVDGDGPDLQVFGESARDDFLLIEISGDGRTWGTFPRVHESPGGLDLAAVGIEQARYVRLTDSRPGTATGAELDAVLALHSQPAIDEDLPPVSDAVVRKEISLRTGPDLRMEEAGTVAAGSLVTVIGRGEAGGWVKVETPSGKSGWCTTVDLGLNVVLNEYDVANAPPTPTNTPAPVPTRPPTVTPRPTSVQPVLTPWPVPTRRYCCKICVKGKACGDTCIARNKTCHVGPGCACNGW